MTPLFELGQTVATPGAFEAMETAGAHAGQLLLRHISGDWGEMCDEDKAQNDAAVASGEDRLMSSYKLPNGTMVWIITEWDRSVTTILLPSEY